MLAIPAIAEGLERVCSRGFTAGHHHASYLLLARQAKLEYLYGDKSTDPMRPNYDDKFTKTNAGKTSSRTVLVTLEAKDFRLHCCKPRPVQPAQMTGSQTTEVEILRVQEKQGREHCAVTRLHSKLPSIVCHIRP